MLSDYGPEPYVDMKVILGCPMAPVPQMQIIPERASTREVMRFGDAPGRALLGHCSSPTILKGSRGRCSGNA